MPPLTLDQVIQAYTAKVSGMASVKERDPIERELLMRLEDPQAAREDLTRIKQAGARPRPE
ncbi:hypothetical protein [Holophaga foetida]|uniref:hypothetical protein n=1 Tax=Holophaga foetida TaxID=35839 RepID=UPI0002471C40|nr:hypothetical protein [Holophaga foetida]